MAIAPNNLPFYALTVAVPVTRTSLMFLINAALATRGAGEAFDGSCSSYQVTAALGNTTTTIYVGDYTLNSVTPAGVGAELTPGLGYFEPYEGGGMRSVDITPIYAMASAATTNYLNIRIRCL